MLKLNKLLSSTVESVFYDCILPTKEQRAELVKAKNDIRDHLRSRVAAATTTELGMDRQVVPRFRTQGSWLYKTCIQPAFLPPQEMDWDLGMYLPVTVWQENGPPHQMAKAYFLLVERLLKELCDERGWHLNTGKDTCIRVHLNATAHIDVPLYAAPDAEFVKIRERAELLAKSVNRNDSATFDADIDEDVQLWAELTTIVLATRDGEWKESDPEAVAGWFLDLVTEHGEQLRRVCRYLKAWRDLNWKSGGPTSVMIMIIVARAFVRHNGRDDRALEDAAQLLAQGFLNDVRERGIDNGKEDFNRLNAEERQEAAARASILHREIKRARMMYPHSAQAAVDVMREQLGDRVPNRASLVDPDTGELAIRDEPARRMPQPAVRSTSAG